MEILLPIIGILIAIAGITRAFTEARKRNSRDQNEPVIEMRQEKEERTPQLLTKVDLNSFKFAWSTIYTALLYPQKLLVENFPERRIFFYYFASSTFVLIPSLLIIVCLMLLDSFFNGAFNSGDGSIVIGGLLFLFLIIPVVLWLANVFFFNGLQIAKATNIIDEDVIRKIIWYIGTAIACLLFWYFIGVGGILSLLIPLISYDLSESMFYILGFCLAILCFRALVLSLKANLNSKILNVVIGIAVGLFLCAFLVLGIWFIIGLVLGIFIG